MSTAHVRLLTVDDHRWETECRKAGHPRFDGERCWCGEVSS